MSIYRTPQGEAEILALYDCTLNQIPARFEHRMLPTRFGETHVLVTGPADAPPLVIFHGGNMVNPISLRWFAPLLKHYRVYAPDTVGHPGRSAQTRLSVKDDSYGQWVVDLLDGLGLDQPTLIGPSYGGGIILRTAAYAPDRIGRAVLLVPASVGLGSTWRMITEILLPMFLYQRSPSPQRLYKAAKPMFTSEPDQDSLEVTGAVFRHLKLEKEFPRLITADDLKGYKAPTLLLAAEKDIFFPARVIVPRLKAAMPHVVAETLAGSGHYPSDEGIAQINRRILRFLGEGK